MTFFSNIWRNEKSREIIVQIIVLFFLGWFISWLVMNVNANFEALGKDKVLNLYSFQPDMILTNIL